MLLKRWLRIRKYHYFGWRIKKQADSLGVRVGDFNLNTWSGCNFIYSWSRLYEMCGGGFIYIEVCEVYKLLRSQIFNVKEIPEEDFQGFHGAKD